MIRPRQSRYFSSGVGPGILAVAAGASTLSSFAAAPKEPTAAVTSAVVFEPEAVAASAVGPVDLAVLVVSSATVPVVAASASESPKS